LSKFSSKSRTPAMSAKNAAPRVAPSSSVIPASIY
jgi:hypothetical protein